MLGLALAWAAASLARRKPSPRRTYGLRLAIGWLESVGAHGAHTVRKT
jgi:Co/Zn/Cd efflux system component